MDTQQLPFLARKDPRQDPRSHRPGIPLQAHPFLPPTHHQTLLFSRNPDAWGGPGRPYRPLPAPAPPLPRPYPTSAPPLPRPCPAPTPPGPAAAMSVEDLTALALVCRLQRRGQAGPVFSELSPLPWPLSCPFQLGRQKCHTGGESTGTPVTQRGCRGGWVQAAHGSSPSACREGFLQR